MLKSLVLLNQETHSYEICEAVVDKSKKKKSESYYFSKKINIFCSWESTNNTSKLGFLFENSEKERNGYVFSSL